MITKTGIDFYPRDVVLMRDRKFNKARQKFGYIIYVIYDALLEMIYGDKGYYIVYDEASKAEVIWELQDFCRGKYSVDANIICQIIEMLVACELFSDDQFKQGIITSKRIQQVYYRTTVERKNICICKNIWMLSLEEMKAISTKSVILRLFEDNQEIKGDNQSIINENRQISSESKVKESKVNKSIVYKNIGKQNKRLGTINNIDNHIINLYFRCFNKHLTEGSEDWDIINEWLLEFDKRLIYRAFEITQERGLNFIGYTKGVVDKWRSDGITSFEKYLFS